MEIASFNDVKVYNLSTGKTLPQWLSEKQKRSLRKDADYRKRIELLQDFEFPAAAQAVRLSGDRSFVMATGTYPPQVKVFDVHELSMKFERHLDFEVVDFLPLADDYGKIVFLQGDRTLAFHAAYGAHCRLRLPRFGRALAWHAPRAELLAAAHGPDQYRLALDAGRFRAPVRLPIGPQDGVNKVAVNARCGLVGFGDDAGACHFWDHRARRTVAALPLGSACTALAFSPCGLQLAAGTAAARAALYDLRAPRPLAVKEHQNGLPVIDMQFHGPSGERILSADAKVVKIWQNKPQHGADQGQVLTNVEASADINGVCVAKDQRGDSGLLMLAGEQPRVMTYYVPALGPAPRWCSFLDSVTEELEEEAGPGGGGGGSVYEDYKFVTRREAEELGAANLIGTPLMKGYMHGFFMDMKLYSKLKAVSEPQAYEEWRKKKLRERVEAKRENRIALQKRLPKVNQEYAQRVMAKEAKDAAKKGTAPKKDAQNVLGDDRFSKMFTSEDFQIDEENEEFKLRNPSGPMKARADDEEESEDEALGGRFRRVGGGGADGDDSSESGTEAEAEGEDSDAVFSGVEYSEDEQDQSGSDEEEEKPRANEAKKKKSNNKGNRATGSKQPRRAPAAPTLSSKARTPKFFEIEEGETITGDDESRQQSRTQRREKKEQAMKPLSERLQEIKKKENQNQKFTASNIVFKREKDFDDGAVSGRVGVVREMTFYPEENKKRTVAGGKEEQEGEGGHGEAKRRRRKARK